MRDRPHLLECVEPRHPPSDRPEAGDPEVMPFGGQSRQRPQQQNGNAEQTDLEPGRFHRSHLVKTSRSLILRLVQAEECFQRARLHDVWDLPRWIALQQIQDRLESVVLGSIVDHYDLEFRILEL